MCISLLSARKATTTMYSGRVDPDSFWMKTFEVYSNSSVYPLCVCNVPAEWEVTIKEGVKHVVPESAYLDALGRVEVDLHDPDDGRGYRRIRTKYDLSETKNYGMSSTVIDTHPEYNVYYAWGTPSELLHNGDAVSVMPGLDLCGITDFSYAWKLSTITAFPPNTNLSNGTNFTAAWEHNKYLLEFPVTLDLSKGVTFVSAWEDNQRMVSFPALDLSSGVDFSHAWDFCLALENFGAVDVSNGVNFEQAWTDCRVLTTFPALNFSAGENFKYTWLRCYQLETFPDISFGSGIDFYGAWYETSAMVEFLATEFPTGVNFWSAWAYSGITSFLNTSFPKGENFKESWKYCNNLVNFDTNSFPKALTFEDAWLGCSKLSQFPENFYAPLATNFYRAWSGCNLTTFPTGCHIPSAQNMEKAWYNYNSTNLKLTSFPADIDLSNATNFNNCWCGNNLTSFPALDLSSGTDFTRAWSHNKLTSFPAGMLLSSGSDFEGAWDDNQLITFPTTLDLTTAITCFSAWSNNRFSSFPLLSLPNCTMFREAWANNSTLVDFPLMVFNPALSYTTNSWTEAWYGTRLSPQSVENVLVALDNCGAVSKSTEIGKDNRALTTAAQTAYDSLVAKGWTVTLTVTGPEITAPIQWVRTEYNDLYSLPTFITANKDASRIAIRSSAGAKLQVYRMSGSAWVNETGVPILTSGYSNLLYSPDGTKLAVSLESASPRLIVYNTSTWTTLYTSDFYGYTYTNACSFSLDGTKLAITNSQAPYLRVFDTTTWAYTSPVGDVSPTGALVISPDNTTLAYRTGGYLQIRTFSPTWSWGPLLSVPSSRTLTKIVFSADGKYIGAISGYDTDNFFVYSVETGALLYNHPQSTPASRPSDCYWSLTEDCFVIIFWPSTSDMNITHVRRFDPVTLSFLPDPPQPPTEILNATMSGNGTALVVRHYDSARLSTKMSIYR